MLGLGRCMATFLSTLIPPASGITKGINTFANKIRELGGEFCGIEACYDAKERKVTFDVFAPMVLTQAPAKDVVKHRENENYNAFSRSLYIYSVVLFVKQLTI